MFHTNFLKPRFDDFLLGQLTTFPFPVPLMTRAKRYRK